MWTAAEAGKEIGVADITVYKWLNGTTYPMPQTMRRIEQQIGWKATEQIMLIPVEGQNLAYGIGLRRALNRYWGDEK